MSTRCFIGVLENDNSIRGIYCHWDGYPEGVGETLGKYYKNHDVIDELLSLGDISELGCNLSETVAYHRDRNEPLNPNLKFKDISDMTKNVFKMGMEYAYVKLSDGWRVYR